jgi:hypothetical protein
MVAIQVPTLIWRVASPISCAVASASLLTSAVKIASKPALFGLARHRTDLGCTPPRAGNDPETQPLCHLRLPLFCRALHYADPK